MEKNMLKKLLGRTHVPHRKTTAAMAPVRMPAPETVLIPTAQHIGAPATPIVKVGDSVFVGTKIAEASGYVSSPVHSSVSGKVKKLEPHLSANGRSSMAIIIESDGEMTPDPAIAPPSVNKFDAEKKGLIKKIVINAAECEPYITSDTRTMLDRSESILGGVLLLEKFISAEEIIIGIEANKPECIEKMTALFSSDPKVKIVTLPSTYPQGAEKILIYNTTGLAVPEGGLPADVGCLVMNITSVAFLKEYFETGMPLVEKCVTVDGSAIKSPKNVIAPIGTPIEKLIEFAGGYSEEPGKILYGGPMMGSAVYSAEYPIMKNTNAIVALNKKEAAPKKSYNCIHCGRCVAACPMGLNPTLYAKAMKVEDKAERAERLSDAKINLCMECGCCSFVCPSARPLVETNRLAKADLRSSQEKK